MVYTATNNTAEYKALITGLKLVNEVRADSLQILCDSQLVVNQLKGTYEIQDPNMIQYLDKAYSLLRII